MPIESVGLDSKLTGIDLDPKTYSPMSGSDENMSSPPSVLTTASAGSCTPSSLPSAGSTPSSIPSAGSTPYQFVTHEESTSIKPLTPSDQQSLPPSTPDQPITPEPSVQHNTVDMLPTSGSDIGTCKKNILPGLHNTTNNCLLRRTDRSPGLSDNEKQGDCPCIICNEKQSTSLQNLTCKDSRDSDEKTDNSDVNMINNPKKSVNISKNKNNKPKLPKVKEPNTVKARRKSCKISKNKIIQYQSEISGESTGIKIRIKLKTSEGTPTKLKSYDPVKTSTASTSHDTYDFNFSDFSPGKPIHKKSLKRKSNKTTKNKSVSNAGKKRKKVEGFSGWGPPLKEVDEERQSGWAYDIPDHILEKIFQYATYTQQCIPFLHRASKICRKWREVAVNPKLWHTVELPTGVIKPRFRTEKKLMWIVENRLKFVEDLNLSGWLEATTPGALRRISELCCRLKTLNLANCSKIRAENLCSLISTSIKLERLDLTNVMGSFKPTPRCAVGQQTMAELTELLKDNLTHLTLASNTLSNVPSIINSLSSHCPNLSVLDLSSVETVGRDFVRLDIEKLQIGCPKLRILRLTNSLFRLSQNSMTVQVAAPGFPELEELSLAVDDRINLGMNDSELERILKNSHKLTLLDVRGCHQITDSSLVKIPPWDISHLFLSGGSNLRTYSDRLELVLRKWQNSLTELDLSWTGTSEAVDAAILALAEEENTKLRVLNLCGSSLNFDPIKKLLRKCSSLYCLNLTSCRALPRGVKRLYDTKSAIDQFKKTIDEGKYEETQNTDH